MQRATFNHDSPKFVKLCLLCLELFWPFFGSIYSARCVTLIVCFPLERFGAEWLEMLTLKLIYVFWYSWKLVIADCANITTFAISFVISAGIVQQCHARGAKPKMLCNVSLTEWEKLSGNCLIKCYINIVTVKIKSCLFYFYDALKKKEKIRCEQWIVLEPIYLHLKIRSQIVWHWLQIIVPLK